MKGKMSIVDKKHSQLIEGLSHLLADTYILALKTQNFHWNVSGPHFIAYHEMFEAQYNQLFSAIDLIAERIRALKAPAPATFQEYMDMTSLQEAGKHLNADHMIRELAADHETMAKMVDHLFHVAEADKDEVTLDILIQRKYEHDKTAWMLRSSRAAKA